MKFNKEFSLGALLIIIIIMVIKPDLLGFLYNNVIGKIIFVAAIVFLTLKHTAAGLIAVVFVALVASMSGYNRFEGMTDGADSTTDEKKDCPDGKCSDKVVTPNESSKDTLDKDKKPEDKLDVSSLLQAIK